MSDPSGQHVPPPDNHLGFSLIAVLLFFPLGIPAMTKSLSVSSLWKQGRHTEALQAAASARTLAIWAVALLVVVAMGALAAWRVLPEVLG